MVMDGAGMWRVALAVGVAFIRSHFIPLVVGFHRSANTSNNINNTTQQCRVHAITLAFFDQMRNVIKY